MQWVELDEATQLSKVMLPGVMSEQYFAILKWYFTTDTYFLPLKHPYIPAMLWC